MIDHRKIVPVSVAAGDADRPREHDEEAGGRLAGFVYPLASRIAARRAEAAHARDLVGCEHRESLRPALLERRPRGRSVLTSSRWLHCISADVLLADFRRPDMRLGRISAGLAQRAPLTQQVPALVQLDLHVGQAFAAFRSEGSLLEKPVLFSHQALNMGEHGWVLARFFHGIPRWMQRELA